MIKEKKFNVDNKTQNVQSNGFYKQYLKISGERKITRNQFKDFLTTKYRDGLDSPKRLQDGKEVKKYKYGLASKITDAMSNKMSAY